MFQTWRQNFWNFFVVYLILGLATGGIGAALSYAVLGAVATGGIGTLPATTGIPTTNPGLVAIYLILTIVAGVVVTTIVQGAMAEYSVRRFRGETMTLGQAIDRGIAKFVSVLGALLLTVLLVVGIVVLPLLVLLPLALSGGAVGAVVALLLGLVIAIVVVIYVGLGLALFAPAIMMENTSAVGGLSRSWSLMKGHRASLFGAVLIVVILEAVIESVFTIPAGLTGVAAIAIVAAAIAGAIVNPWFVVLTAVAYDLLVKLYPAMPPGGGAYIPGTPAGVPLGNAPPTAPGTFQRPGA